MCKQHRLKSNQSIHVLLPLEVLAFLVIHPRQGQVPPVLQDRTAKIPLLSGSKWWHPDPDGDKSRELPGNLTGSPSERSRAMISPESRALPSQLPPTSRDHSPGSDPSQLMDTAGRKHAHVKASPLGTHELLQWVCALCLPWEAVVSYAINSRKAGLCPKQRKREFPKNHLIFSISHALCVLVLMLTRLYEAVWMKENHTALHYPSEHGTLAVCINHFGASSYPQ